MASFKKALFTILILSSCLSIAEDKCQSIVIAVDQADCYQSQRIQLENELEVLRKNGAKNQNTLDKMNSDLIENKVLIKKILVEKAGQQKNVMEYDGAMSVVSMLIAFEKKINEMSSQWTRIKAVSENILETKAENNDELKLLKMKLEANKKNIIIFKSNLKFYLNDYQSQLANLNSDSVFVRIQGQIKSLESYFTALDSLTNTMEDYSGQLEFFSFKESVSVAIINWDRLTVPSFVEGTKLKTLRDQYDFYTELLSQLKICKTYKNQQNCVDILNHEEEIKSFSRNILLKTFQENKNILSQFVDLSADLDKNQKMFSAGDLSAAVNANDSLCLTIGKVMNE